ncbi:P1 family peptidase [Micromonospora chalcea]|uniref:P1 family peptidase n=1 Tax=Micromonospora chalcea TaxID=1874 RepID=UPI0033323791
MAPTAPPPAGPPAGGGGGPPPPPTALGFKGGIGTSSRTVRAAGRTGTVGALVQSNFGGVLRVLGVPMPAEELVPAADRAEPPGNSCMIVVATDVPLDARQLGRVARRAVFAMARVGASFSGTSGDYAIGFTTSDQQPIPDGEIDPVFAAVLDAVEEALLNSLFTAVTTTGVGGRTSHAVPHRAVLERLAAAGRLIPESPAETR